MRKENLDEDPIKELDKERQKWFKEQHWILCQRKNQKTLNIQRNALVFRIRLGSGRPPKITSIKITLDESREPVKVIVRKYPAYQRRFFNAYFDQLLEMWFYKRFSRSVVAHCATFRAEGIQVQVPNLYRLTSGQCGYRSWTMAHAEHWSRI